MKIYIASSWRNTYYPSVVSALRDAGQPNAQFFLGENLLQAYHIERDYVAAYEYLSKAGEAGHPKALFYLGKCHLHGKGVPKCDTLAIRFFRRAVEAGDTISKDILDSLQLQTYKNG